MKLFKQTEYLPVDHQATRDALLLAFVLGVVVGIGACLVFYFTTQ